MRLRRYTIPEISLVPWIIELPSAIFGSLNLMWFISGGCSQVDFSRNFKVILWGCYSLLLPTCLGVVVEPGSVGEVPVSNPVPHHQTMASFIIAFTSSSCPGRVQGTAGLSLANNFIRSELNKSARAERYLSIFVTSTTRINMIVLLGIYCQSRTKAGHDGYDETKFDDHFVCKIVAQRGSGPQTNFLSDGMTWLTDCVTRARIFNFHFFMVDKQFHHIIINSTTVFKVR